MESMKQGGGTLAEDTSVGEGGPHELVLPQCVGIIVAKRGVHSTGSQAPLDALQTLTHLTLKLREVLLPSCCPRITKRKWPPFVFFLKLGTRILLMFIDIALLLTKWKVPEISDHNV